VLLPLFPKTSFFAQIDPPGCPAHLLKNPVRTKKKRLMKKNLCVQPRAVALPATFWTFRPPYPPTVRISEVGAAPSQLPDF
jgi:hypothetical protein